MAASKAGDHGWWSAVDIYCERISHPDFWGEPLNAMSNLAFLIAAVMAYSDYCRRPPERGGGMIIFLIIWMMVIGVGSFLFHTFATRWAGLVDVVPIAIFVLSYLVLALRWFVGLALHWAILIGLAVAVGSQFMPPWFNGSFGYAPPLLCMVVIGALLVRRDHPAGRWVAMAAGIFFVSLVFRTLDGGAGCLRYPEGSAAPDFVFGTHPFWHVLNGVTLYLLVRAAIENPPARV